MAATIEITDEAAAVLRRSLELGAVDAGGGIRLRRARALGGGSSIQIELSDGPLAEEDVFEVAGLRLFVAPELLGSIPDPVVALDPQHDTITVRPRDAAG